MWRPTIALALVLLARVASAAFIDSNLAISPDAQQNGGGCYPLSLYGPAGEGLNRINPEWAAIDPGTHQPPDADPVTLHGTVVLTMINEGSDFGGDHVSDDNNTFIDVDPADMGLVATGNVGPRGEEAGQLEMEWEIGSYPLFAWAGAGDRLTAVGRWIWDCGHGDPHETIGGSPYPLGSCTTTMSQTCALDVDCAPPACPTCVSGERCVGTQFNYHSELHPPQAVAVSRVGAWAYSRRPRGGGPATRTDVWISPDGGGAGDRCIVRHRPNPFDVITEECFPLSQPLANVNAEDFAVDIPLPPPPGPGAAPRIAVFDQTPRGLPRPAVRTTFVDGPTPVVHAVVDMTTRVRGRLPSMVGKTIVAGWRRDPTPTTRVEVRVTAIEILNPLKPVRPVVPGHAVPGWQVFLEVNGVWQQLGDLEGVTAPGVVPQTLRYDVGIRPGGALHIHATGRSLDCRDLTYSMNLARALGLFGTACVSAESHEIGELDLSLPGPDFGAGGGSAAHVTQSIGGAGGRCVAGGALCLTDADCAAGDHCGLTGGSYRLHYTIRRRH